MVVLSALLMFGFPGLAMISLLDSNESTANGTASTNFQKLFLNGVETMLPYTTPYVYPGTPIGTKLIYFHDKGIVGLSLRMKTAGK